MGGLTVARLKLGFSASTKSHAASSASFLEALLCSISILLGRFFGLGLTRIEVA